MTQKLVSEMETIIRDRLQALEAEDKTSAQSRDTVVLDQQSVGRLSRMDALQQQAMAQATHRRRQGERAQLQAALKRIEAGEYGACLDCGDEIGAARLRLAPTVLKCRECAG